MGSIGPIATEILLDNASLSLPTNVSKEAQVGDWAPLSYRMIKSDKPHQCWSHNLYHDSNGKKVEVLYSKTKEQSEVLAKRFLTEPVVGFDSM